MCTEKRIYYCFLVFVRITFFNVWAPPSRIMKKLQRRRRTPVTIIKMMWLLYIYSFLLLNAITQRLLPVFLLGRFFLTFTLLSSQMWEVPMILLTLRTRSLSLLLHEHVSGDWKPHFIVSLCSTSDSMRECARWHFSDPSPPSSSPPSANRIFWQRRGVYGGVVGSARPEASSKQTFIWIIAKVSAGWVSHEK